MPRRPFRDGLMTLEPLALVGTRCRNCGATSFPWRSTCPKCRSSEEPEQVELSTTGTLYTYTIVRQAPPGEQVPYGLGYVDLPEGVRVLAQLDRTRLDELEVGIDVRLAPRPMGQADDGAELVGYLFEPTV
jgi:uncharacterized OB-fold protein